MVDKASNDILIWFIVERTKSSLEEEKLCFIGLMN